MRRKSCSKLENRRPTPPPTTPAGLAQGLAVLELLALDVPLLHAATTPPLPYLAHCGAACGRAFTYRAQAFPGDYARFAADYAPGPARAATAAAAGSRWAGPRDYVVRELSLEESAVDFLRMVCGRPTRWDGGPA